MPNPFRTEITQEMVDAMPEGQRDLWQKQLDGRKWRDEEIERLAADRQFVGALNWLDSQDRADKIVEWDEKYHFTDDEALDIIMRTWSITEAWSGDERLRDGMYGLLKRVAPVEVIREDDPRQLPKSPYLTVYRGNLGETPGDHLASWTLDREIAERFALMANGIRGWFLGMSEPGSKGVPTVWKARVARERVLGYFDDRGEQEVVIDGQYLRRVTKIAEAAGDNVLVATEES